MHFCHQELVAIMMAIPGCALLAVYVRGWIHKHLECHGHHKPLKTYGGPPDSSKSRAWPWRD